MSEYERQDGGLAHEPTGQGFGSGAESESEKSPEEIEQEIEETRNRMSQNIDELGDRLNPDNLKHEAKNAIRTVAQDAVSNVGEQARRTGSRLVDVIREYPLPVIAVGAGVTWLLTQRSHSEVSGDRMARYAYTGPERRQGTSWQHGSGIKGRVGDAVGEVKEKVSEATSGIADRAGELARGENPLMVAIGATIVGLALGLLLPGTERENELMGPARDRLMDRAENTAERVKNAATEAGREVTETVKAEIAVRAPEVKEAVQQAGQGVKDQVKESARKVKREAKDAAKEPDTNPRSGA